MVLLSFCYRFVVGFVNNHESSIIKSGSSYLLSLDTMPILFLGHVSYHLDYGIILFVEAEIIGIRLFYLTPSASLMLQLFLRNALCLHQQMKVH